MLLFRRNPLLNSSFLNRFASRSSIKTPAWIALFLLLATGAAAQTTQSFTSSSLSLSSETGSATFNVPAGTVTGPLTNVTLTFTNICFTKDDTDGAGLNLNDYAFALEGPGGQWLDVLDDVGNTPNTAASCPNSNANITLTLKDGASAPSIGSTATISSSTYAPTDGNPLGQPDVNFSPGPGTPQQGTAHAAATFGTGTFSNVFGGLTGSSANGTWTVYMVDGGVQYGQAQALGSIASLTLTLTWNASESATTTSLASNLNPSYTTSPNNSVTLTATVTSSGTVSGGTVSFFDGGSAISCSGGNQIVSNGSATCITTFSTQGVHSLTASYGGSGSFAASGLSTAVSQTVNGHTTQSVTPFATTGPSPCRTAHPPAPQPFPIHPR